MKVTKVTKPIPHETCSCGAEMFITATSLDGQERERASFREAHAICRAVSDLAVFPYGAPAEEFAAAREAAVEMLWDKLDKRPMLPEDSREIVEDVLKAALPFFRFYPLGDNHHRAAACPYCSPGLGK